MPTHPFAHEREDLSVPLGQPLVKGSLILKWRVEHPDCCAFWNHHQESNQFRLARQPFQVPVQLLLHDGGASEHAQVAPHSLQGTCPMRLRPTALNGVQY